MVESTKEKNGGNMRLDKNKIIMLLFEIALIFLLFQENVFPSELTFVSLLLTIVFGIFFLVKGGKLYFNPFIITYVLFIIYMILDTSLRGNIEEYMPTIGMYVMQLVSSLCIYNYLIKCQKIEGFLKIYTIVAIISLIIIFVILGENALSTRLGHNGSGAIVSYYIFDNPIYKSSNGTANFCAIATFFLLYFAENKRKRYCYIPIIFLTIGLILCGSRKGLLVYVIYVIYTYFFMRKGITIKKILIFLLIPFVLYFTIMKIPLVYDVIGERIESMVLNLFDVSNTLDGNSYLMRQELKDTAIEWITRKPFFGYGKGTFENAMGYGAENNLLQIMLEFGLIGTIIYYSFLPFFIHEIIKLKNKSVLAKVLGIVAITMLIQDYGSVTYSWQTMTMWYSVFWAIIKIDKIKNDENYEEKRNKLI